MAEQFVENSKSSRDSDEILKEFNQSSDDIKIFEFNAPDVELMTEISKFCCIPSILDYMELNKIINKYHVTETLQEVIAILNKPRNKFLTFHKIFQQAFRIDPDEFGVTIREAIILSAINITNTIYKKTSIIEKYILNEKVKQFISRIVIIYKFKIDKMRSEITIYKQIVEYLQNQINKIIIDEAYEKIPLIASHPMINLLEELFNCINDNISYSIKYTLIKNQLNNKTIDNFYDEMEIDNSFDEQYNTIILKGINDIIIELINKWDSIIISLNRLSLTDFAKKFVDPFSVETIRDVVNECVEEMFVEMEKDIEIFITLSMQYDPNEKKRDIIKKILNKLLKQECFNILIELSKLISDKIIFSKCFKYIKKEIEPELSCKLLDYKSINTCCEYLNNMSKFEDQTDVLLSLPYQHKFTATRIKSIPKTIEIKDETQTGVVNEMLNSFSDLGKYITEILEKNRVGGNNSVVKTNRLDKKSFKNISSRQSNKLFVSDSNLDYDAESKQYLTNNLSKKTFCVFYEMNKNVFEVGCSRSITRIMSNILDPNSNNQSNDNSNLNNNQSNTPIEFFTLFKDETLNKIIKIVTDKIIKNMQSELDKFKNNICEIYKTSTHFNLIIKNKFNQISILITTLFNKEFSKKLNNILLNRTDIVPNIPEGNTVINLNIHGDIDLIEKISNELSKILSDNKKEIIQKKMEIYKNKYNKNNERSDFIRYKIFDDCDETSYYLESLNYDYKYQLSLINEINYKIFVENFDMNKKYTCKGCKCTKNIEIVKEICKTLSCIKYFDIFLWFIIKELDLCHVNLDLIDETSDKSKIKSIINCIIQNYFADTIILFPKTFDLTICRNFKFKSIEISTQEYENIGQICDYTGIFLKNIIFLDDSALNSEISNFDNKKSIFKKIFKHTGINIDKKIEENNKITYTLFKIDQLMNIKNTNFKLYYFIYEISFIVNLLYTYANIRMENINQLISEINEEIIEKHINLEEIPEFKELLSKNVPELYNYILKYITVPNLDDYIKYSINKLQKSTNKNINKKCLNKLHTFITIMIQISIAYTELVMIQIIKENYIIIKFILLRLHREFLSSFFLNSFKNYEEIINDLLNNININPNKKKCYVEILGLTCQVCDFDNQFKPYVESFARLVTIVSKFTSQLEIAPSISDNININYFS
jgi:hypothetical protein